MCHLQQCQKTRAGLRSVFPPAARHHTARIDCALGAGQRRCLSGFALARRRTLGTRSCGADHGPCVRPCTGVAGRTLRHVHPTVLTTLASGAGSRGGVGPGGRSVVVTRVLLFKLQHFSFAECLAKSVLNSLRGSSALARGARLRSRPELERTGDQLHRVRTERAPKAAAPSC